MSLNSAASSLISSCPPTSARWLYEPSRILRMASVSTPKRRVSTRDKSTLIPPGEEPFAQIAADIEKHVACPHLVLEDRAECIRRAILDGKDARVILLTAVHHLRGELAYR